MGRLRLAAGALPLVLILGACSSGASTPPASTAPSAAPSTAASPSSPAASPSSPAASPSDAAEAEYELKVGTGTGATASYLTGENGLTLYTFTKDVKDSGKSVCNGGCATNWPPYAVDALDEVKADSGATGTLALATRDDGTKQVTYNGLPLYYFASDKAAGDVTGQGVGGVWFVAAP